MVVEPLAINTPLALLAAAREIAPRLDAGAREAERLRTMPPELVGEARRAGLFQLAAPRALGGAELPPAAIVEIIEELCRADGSAGWTILIGNASAFLAWLDPAVAAELVAGRPDAICASVFAPMGRLTPDGPDRFRLDGRWSFASGALNADFFINGALFGDDWRLAVVRAADASVIDNWDTAGLRGTGSHDVAVESLAVAEKHTMSPFFGPARHDGPLWRFPFFALVGTFFVGFPLGVARRALDEFAAMATTKVRPPGPSSIAEDGDLQVALARAEGGLQAARAYVFDALGEMWDSACAGDVPPVEQRARFLLAAQQAMRASVDAVDTAFGFGGAGALRMDNPLQRCFRDVHAAAQHIYFSPTSAKRYAKTRLGIDQPTCWL